MRIAPSLFVAALLPLFAGCQLLADQPETSVSTAGMTRLQGELSAANGQLLFKPCTESRRFVVQDAGNTGLLQEAATLAATPGVLFADLRGTLSSSKSEGADGQFNVHQLYRLDHSASACSDPNFKRLTLRAAGHEPFWNLNVSGQGMVLNRPDQPPLALPYLEEQMPGGGISVSSEANGQKVELWLAPQRCVDSATGGVSHLTAQLRLDGQTLQGCGYFGGSRND
ncbi:COG3650 family protein [Pseudomonas bharatica]|uniref:COG3650 family protein n=1 Tax=Pseudomonas TaxID=286 RepID=UPI003B282944